MKVSGTATLNASREAVWSALNDPEVLVRTIPGCQRLEAIAADSYRLTLTAGVASIKGVYQGQVSLCEQQPPETFRLKASGAGAPGTVSADVLVRLDERGDTTELTYDADAVIGGMIGGVGQRMLSGVAKKTAAEFFAAVDQVLSGAPAAVARTDAQRPGGTPSTTVFERPEALQAPTRRGEGFVPGAVVGAVAALVGAVVGGWITDRWRTSR